MKKKKKWRLLKDIDCEEVSFVDHGANQRIFIFTKSAKQKAHKHAVISKATANVIAKFKHDHVILTHAEFEQYSKDLVNGIWGINL